MTISNDDTSKLVCWFEGNETNLTIGNGFFLAKVLKLA